MNLALCLRICKIVIMKFTCNTHDGIKYFRIFRWPWDSACMEFNDRCVVQTLFTVQSVYFLQLTKWNFLTKFNQVWNNIQLNLIRLNLLHYRVASLDGSRYFKIDHVQSIAWILPLEEYSNWYILGCKSEELIFLVFHGKNANYIIFIYRASIWW